MALMARFHKGQVVYRACIASFEGGDRPLAILAKIATVNPQRDGSTRYHLHNFDGLERAHGHVWATYAASEDTLYTDPLEAMQKAVAACTPGARRSTDDCSEGVAHA